MDVVIKNTLSWNGSYFNMRNIDRLRSMSLEEIAPYLVYRTMINKSEVWYSPSGYTFSNKDAAIENCIHWLDKEYHKEN